MLQVTVKRASIFRDELGLDFFHKFFSKRLSDCFDVNSDESAPPFHVSPNLTFGL